MTRSIKNVLIYLTAAMFNTIIAEGQNLFFIGEQCYPSSETFRLQSNSNEYHRNDLNVLFAKDGERTLFVASTGAYTVFFRGKLIIYLDDPTVITLADGSYDYVDNIASAAYYLPTEELRKMIKSNINTEYIRR